MRKSSLTAPSQIERRASILKAAPMQTTPRTHSVRRTQKMQTNHHFQMKRYHLCHKNLFHKKTTVGNLFGMRHTKHSISTIDSQG